MRTISENENNDMFVGPDGHLSMSSGLAATMQVCKSTMEVVIGEMVFQINDGMPLFESAFNFYRPAQFEAAGRLRLLAVDGVTSIESFDVSRTNDALTYTVMIVTIYGKDILNG